MAANRWIRAGALTLAAAFILWAAYFIFRTSFVAVDGRRYFSLVDDAMISMRYAWNFSHGAGLVWNPGERVEGYTNLLMVGLMSVWTRLFDKPGAVLAVQLTGIPILLAIAALTLLLWLELAKGNDVLHREGFAALAFMGSLLYYPLAYWTLMGMETGLVTALLLTGSLLTLVHIRTGSYGTLVGGAAAFGFCYLARPDSAPASALMLGGAALLAQGAFRRRLTAAVIALATLLLFPAVQTIFRATYYGSLVPLTYTLKMTGMPFAVRFENGLGFIRPYLSQARWAYLLAIAGGFLGFSKRKALLLIPPLTLVAYQVLIGGDALGWRLVAPGVPYLIVLTLAALDWLIGAIVKIASEPGPQPLTLLREPVVRSLESASRRLPLIVALTAVVLVLGSFLADLLPGGSAGFGYAQRYLLVGGVLLAFAATVAREQPMRHLFAFSVTLLVLVAMNRPFLTEAVLFSLPNTVEKNRNHVNVALSINRLTTEDASVGVIWAGIIPYYTSRYGIDFLGKNDPYIAGLPADISGAFRWGGMYSVPGHNKYDLEYSILARRPTYVEWFGWGSQDLTPIVKDLYVEVSVPGPDPAFLLGDPAVRWDLIPPEKLIYLE